MSYSVHAKTLTSNSDVLWSEPLNVPISGPWTRWKPMLMRVERVPRWFIVRCLLDVDGLLARPFLTERDGPFKNEAQCIKACALKALAGDD